MCTPRLRSLAGSVTLAVAALSATPSQAGAISVGFTGHAGDRLTAAMTVTDLASFEAGDFTFSFDLGLLSLQSVQAGSLTGGFSVLAGPAVPQASGSLADVIVSLITGGGPVSGDGTLFTAIFTLVADTGATPAELGLGFDELAYGYSLGTAAVTLTSDATNAVPIVNSAALALAGLLALGTATRASRARSSRRA